MTDKWLLLDVPKSKFFLGATNGDTDNDTGVDGRTDKWLLLGGTGVPKSKFLLGATNGTIGRSGAHGTRL